MDEQLQLPGLDRTKFGAEMNWYVATLCRDLCETAYVIMDESRGRR